MGVCYLPYHEADKARSDYTEDDIDKDLGLIARHYRFIRTYTVEYANQFIIPLADKHGLQVAAGIWIVHDNPENTRQRIDTVLSQANDHPGTVKVVVIGNEVDREIFNYSVDEVRDHIRYAKARKLTYPNVADTPVSICFTGKGYLAGDWMSLLDECEGYILLTVYPWWADETPPPDDIRENMEWSYENGIRQAEERGLVVILAEIGWPSAGRPDRGTTPANEKINYETTCSWILGHNKYRKKYLTFWFEMFDEPWKTDEGAQGPFWGLYGSGVMPEPKFTIRPCCLPPGTLGPHFLLFD